MSLRNAKGRAALRHRQYMREVEFQEDATIWEGKGIPLSSVQRRFGLSNLGIRRNKQDHVWRIADRARLVFISEFKSGLIASVTFVHNAPQLKYVPGYVSTGEAIGTIVYISENALTMPPAVKRSVEITYDNVSRQFQTVGENSRVVESADYLLLLPDGKAFVGLKE